MPPGATKSSDSPAGAAAGTKSDPQAKKNGKSGGSGSSAGSGSVTDASSSSSGSSSNSGTASGSAGITELRSIGSPPSQSSPPVKKKDSDPMKKLFLPIRTNSAPIPDPLSSGSSESSDSSSSDNKETASQDPAVMRIGDSKSSKSSSSSSSSASNGAPVAAKVSNTQLYELDQPEVFIEPDKESSEASEKKEKDGSDVLMDDDELYELDQPGVTGSTPVTAVPSRENVPLASTYPSMTVESYQLTSPQPSSPPAGQSSILTQIFGRFMYCLCYLMPLCLGSRDRK